MADSTSAETGVGGQNGAAAPAIKLLKPDAQGIMSAVFNKFVPQDSAEGQPILTFTSFTNLLAACGLDASIAATVVASGVFERLCRVEAALAGSGGYSSPGVSFRVFPTLLSDTAVQVARATAGSEGYVATVVSDTEARQTFMRKNVLPLHGKIVKENKEKASVPPAAPVAAPTVPPQQEAAASAAAAPAATPAQPPRAATPPPPPAMPATPSAEPQPVQPVQAAPAASTAEPAAPVRAAAPPPPAPMATATPAPPPPAPAASSFATPGPSSQYQQPQSYTAGSSSNYSHGYASADQQHHASAAEPGSASRLLRPTASSAARSSSARNLRARLSLQQQGQVAVPSDHVGADRDAGRRDSWMYMRPEGFYRVPDAEPDPNESAAAPLSPDHRRSASVSKGRGFHHEDSIREEGNGGGQQGEAAWEDFLSRQQAAIEHKAAKMKALALQVLAEEAGKGVGAVTNLQAGGPMAIASTPAGKGKDSILREGALQRLPSELKSVAAALRTPTLSAGTKRILAQAQQAAEKMAAVTGSEAMAVPSSSSSSSASKKAGKGSLSAARAASATRVVMRGNGAAAAPASSSSGASATTSAVVAVNRAQSQTRSRSHLRSAAAGTTGRTPAKQQQQQPSSSPNGPAESGSSDKPVPSPTFSMGQRSRAQTGVSLAGSHTSRPGSEALYANAMGKLQRQKQAIKAADNAAKKASEVKANAKSDALLRQRLGREIAAACVYIAARRALTGGASVSSPANNAATADGTTTTNTATANEDGETVVPWWLLELSPSEVADILVHCGFLGEPALPPIVAEAAARGVFEWALPASARFDGVPIANAAQGAAQDGETSYSAATAAAGAQDVSFGGSSGIDDDGSASEANNPFTNSARSRARSISTRRSVSGGGAAPAFSSSSVRSRSGSAASQSRARSSSRDRLDLPPSALVPVVTMGGSSATAALAAAGGTTVNGAVPVASVHLQSARLLARVWDALTWTGALDRVTGALTAPLPASAASSPGKQQQDGASAAIAASLARSMEAAASGGLAEGHAAHDRPEAMAVRLRSLQTRVTAVRLLALLQALLTGGYDVRRKTLSAAGTELGLAHPFLTLPNGNGPASGASPLASGEGAAQQRTADSNEPKASAAGANLSPEVTQQLPSAFASALKAHSERLRGLSTAIQAGRLPPASPPPVHLASSASAPSAGVGAAVAVPSPTQALLSHEVLEGRLLWPIHVLIPLQRLYSNRLAYLGNLTRRDTRPDVGIGAAAEIVTLTKKAQQSGLANPLALQAPSSGSFLRQKSAPSVAVALGGSNTPAIASPFGTPSPAFPDGAFGSAASTVGAAVEGAVVPLGPGMSYSDAQECTFQPMLCKKSLAIAGRQEWERGGRRAGIGGGIDGTAQGHAIAAASSAHKDPNSPLPMPSSFASANNGGSGSNVNDASAPRGRDGVVPREVALMEFAARADARLKHARAQRVASELAECSFKPNLSKGKHILQPSRGASASSSSSGNAGAAGPSGSQTPSSAAHGADSNELNAHLAANLGLLHRGADGDADGDGDGATAAGRSSVSGANNNNGGLNRGELLYSLAALRANELARARQEVLIARSAAELEGCTFAPQIHASPRARRVARSLATASGPGALSSAEAGRAVQRGRGEQAGKEPIPEALAAALLPRVADTLGSPGHLAARIEERKRARSLLAELAVAAEHGGLAHLGLSGANPATTGLTSEDGGAGVEGSGPFPNGMSSHLARMARSAAQRATREQLQAALSAGVLHKVKDKILSLPTAPAAGVVPGDDADEQAAREADIGQQENQLGGGYYEDSEPQDADGRTPADERSSDALGSPGEPPASAPSSNADSLKELHQQQQLAALQQLAPDALQALAYQALLAQAQAQAQALQQLSSMNASQQLQSSLVPGGTGEGNLISSNNYSVLTTSALGASRSDEGAQQQRGPPLLFVDVAISPSSSDRIPLWKDTDCAAAAQAFASKHGLSAKMQARLAKMLGQQRDALTLAPPPQAQLQQVKAQ